MYYIYIHCVLTSKCAVLEPQQKAPFLSYVYIISPSCILLVCWMSQCYKARVSRSQLHPFVARNIAHAQTSKRQIMARRLCLMIKNCRRAKLESKIPAKLTNMPNTFVNNMAFRGLDDLQGDININ